MSSSRWASTSTRPGQCFASAPNVCVLPVPVAITISVERTDDSCSPMRLTASRW